MTVQVNEDVRFPHGEVESKFKIESLLVEQFEVEVKTLVNRFTKVDELTAVNVNVGKSLELTKHFEEPKIIIYDNVINLDKRIH